jgi:acetate kinase
VTHRSQPFGDDFPVLALNMGSSSLKFSLYMLRDDGATLLADGEVERIGLPAGRVWAGRGGKIVEDREGNFRKHGDAIKTIFDILDRPELPRPAAAGHRIVHGGADYAAPAKVDATLVEALRGLIPFAPLHLPAEIRVIEAVAHHFPELRQVACFDTAFHRRMPETAQRLPLGRTLWEEGIRRYGFHGLSYEYIVGALGRAAEGRVIIAHLGNGASMAAVRNREPMDTSMGFTPTGGFMMGTRSGDLDPGVIMFLLTEKGYDAAAIDKLVNRDSGLLGVSGVSSDMKTLLEKREGDPHAAQAVAMFCYQVRKQIGAYASVLGGLDTLVFTGGIGEHAAPVRAEICGGLQFLGIEIDPERNSRHEEIISTPEGRCVVRVMPTKEDLMIARHTRAVVMNG